jgi:predicted nucleotidyltransferase
MAVSNDLDLDRLLPRLRQAAPKIFGDRPVMLAYLHGSVVRGTPLPSSDIDIAILLEPDLDISPYDRTILEFDIAAEYEKACELSEVDVRSITSAPLTVQGKVVTEGILFYSRDEGFRVDYEVSTRKRYFDFLPVDRLMRTAFFNNVRERGLTIDQSR